MASVMFFIEKACIISISSSNITLIPKKKCPQRVSSYRTICLLNTLVTLLNKLLANRLQEVMKNPYS
jgi:hypothetical protein